MRILAWIKRFADNCKEQQRRAGPLTTEKFMQQKNFLIKKAQDDADTNRNTDNNREKLNLQKNSDGKYECIGRIQGVFSLFTYHMVTSSQKS